MIRLLCPALLLISLFVHQECYSKEYDHTVQGRVVDNMTGLGMDSVRITLMNNDSTIITTGMTWPKEMGSHVGIYQFHITKVGKYIIKAEREGYDTGYMNCELRSQREGNIPVRKIRLTKVSHILDEVTIRATKVKMVVRGDTIVYNADAFNLAEGSMLDALISRLPGTKLMPDGRIYVNGKFIQSLLVNGKDFFAGNPKIALENLPAYTVNKVKVYHKEGQLSRMMGKKMGDETYVMDVNLKKEYSTGYMANTEAGAGSKSRFIGKLFGMKLSDVERIGAFANVNNLNDNRQARLNGEWIPTEAPTGLQTTRNTGLSYIHYLGEDAYSWISSSNVFTHSNNEKQSHSTAQTYLPNGDTFQRVESRYLSRNRAFDSKNNFTITRNDHYLKSNFDFSYSYNQGWDNTIQNTSDSLFHLNQMLMRSSDERKQLNALFSHSGGKKIIADYIRWGVSASYEQMKTENFSLHDVQYMNSTTPCDYINNYLDNASHQWKLHGNLSYSLGWPHQDIMLDYDYHYIYNKTDNMLYRLDKLTDIDSTFFTLLPSAREALAGVMDRNNSYQYREYQNHHQFLLKFNRENIGRLLYRFLFRLPVRLARQNLYYNRIGRHTVLKHAVFLEPYLYARGTVFEHQWELEASANSRMPDLTLMVDYRDDSNPLDIRLGNPNLKNIHRYDATLSLRREGKRQRMTSFNMGYHRQDNAVAYGLSVDKETGVFTSKPISVDGNWNANMEWGHTQALDSTQKWTIDNKFNLNYQHSVDMVLASGSMQSQRSIVHNQQWGDDIRLNFRPNDDYEFSLHAGGKYYFVSSRREGFKNIHAGEYNAGVNATISLPAHFQLTTDMTMYARRGYQQSDMNTTDWIWNAQITRTFLKGQLLAKLQGFDLLHQLTNTRYVMNEQGRSETWHNSIPRYVMLSLAWRFSKYPKK